MSIPEVFLLLPLLALLVSLSPSNAQKVAALREESSKKVIIIGAGIAGLSAADYFRKKGIHVTVLEAQERVGGRLKTDRSLGLVFDQGASWIHGPKGNPITPLAKSSGARTYLTKDSKTAVFDSDGKEYPKRKLRRAERKFDRILDRIEGHEHKSFEEVFYKKYPQFKENRLWTYMLSAFLEFDTGGDISALSSLDFYDDEAFRGKDVIITNGYDQIAEPLAKGLDIHLNTKVYSINYSDEKIEMETSQGHYLADHVLLTVPLGVLKKGIISFTPSLPNGTLQAIKKLQMGSVNKFLCTWEKAFWDTQLQYIGYTPETKGKFNYFLNMKTFTDRNALMTFTYGDYSLLAEQMSDEEVISEIMVHLRSIYGDSIPSPTQMSRTKWGTDTATFGAYSFATKDTRSKDFKVLGTPIDNKLFFAGEHTSKKYRGTVHGAYLSGIREAKRIIRLLAP